MAEPPRSDALWDMLTAGATPELWWHPQTLRDARAFMQDLVAWGELLSHAGRQLGMRQARLWEQAVSEQKQRRTADPNGTGPTGDMPDDAGALPQQALLDLVLNHPDIQPALKRDIDLDATQHAYYDQLLADAGVQAQWSDTDIIALIHEGNARSARPTPPPTACHLMIQQARLRTKTGDLEAARAQLLTHLSHMWGLGIKTVIRHGIENALWHLALEDGREIQLGTSKDLLSQAQVRFKIFDVTGHTIKRYSARETHLWDHHVELVALAAVTVDTPEMTRLGQARALVLGYLETQYCPLDHDTSSEEWEGLALANKPFMRQGTLFLAARHLWLAHVRIVAPTMTQTDLLDLLRLLGGRRGTINIMNPKKTSRSIWRIPPANLDEAQPLEETLKILSNPSSQNAVNA